MKDKDLSKFLSLILRHKPEKVGIALDQNGWADVAELLLKLQQQGLAANFEQLKRVVETNNKQRFSFNPDQTKIRANQGHSVLVDVELTPITPPETLYHGTSTVNAEIIKKEGLKKQSRLHVHLSSDIATALQVGSRHGKPYVFTVHSGQMHRQGIPFYLSENKVWLTDFVAPEFLEEKKAEL